MSIWNKILVGLIAVASLGFFYLAARTLKTHTYWSGKAAAAEARIEQLKAANKQLEPGIRQLRVDLYKLLVDRRRAWFNCPARVTRLDRADGTAEITVTIDKASPDRIAQKNVFYAFDDTPVQQKGRYLGEFVVTSVADKQVALAPAVKLNSREINNLATAKGTWTLYEVMPQDSHDIFADPMFAGLSDAEKKAILPADSVAQYLKDGQPAAKDDPKQSVVDGKYVRPLRDYDVLFRADQEKEILLTDAIDAAGRDKKLVQEALALAQTQVDACTRDIAAAKDELAGMTAQRKLVADYLAKFHKALDEVRAAMKKTLQDNQAKAGQIAKLQLEAAERIDRRTRAMAQSGAERQQRVGIYDRDYYRRVQRPGLSSYAPRNVVVTLIAINVAVWLIDGLILPETRLGAGWLAENMGVHVAPRDFGHGAMRDTLTHPLLWWQYLTAGFAHSPTDFTHILFNMIALFFFGRAVEETYGSKEFLRLYLVMTVFASLVWDVANKMAGAEGTMIGASGAIAGTVILFALNYPRATVLLFFVIPMPAWVAGVLFVGLDMLGAFGARPHEHIAFSAHLAGAAFAFAYYEQRWNLTRLTQGFRWPRISLRGKPRLRVHEPEQDIEPGLNQEVDRILEKISRQGEASLTAKERHTLETASREYQKKMTKDK